MILGRFIDRMENTITGKLDNLDRLASDLMSGSDDDKDLMEWTSSDSDSETEKEKNVHRILLESYKDL